MIQVTVQKHKDGSYVEFEASGHAEYGDPGTDIICSAVSALVITACNSIEQFTEDAFDEDQTEDGGYVRLAFPEGNSPEAKLLMNSLMLGLSQIEESCPDFVKVSIREV